MDKCEKRSAIIRRSIHQQSIKCMEQKRAAANPAGCLKEGHLRQFVLYLSIVKYISTHFLVKLLNL